VCVENTKNRRHCDIGNDRLEDVREAEDEQESSNKHVCRRAGRQVRTDNTDATVDVRAARMLLGVH
jgi:hypothetical protein